VSAQGSESRVVCGVALELVNPPQRFDPKCGRGPRNGDLTHAFDLWDSTVGSLNQFVQFANDFSRDRPVRLACGPSAQLMGRDFWFQPFDYFASGACLGRASRANRGDVPAGFQRLTARLRSRGSSSRKTLRSVVSSGSRLVPTYSRSAALMSV